MNKRRREYIESFINRDALLTRLEKMKPNIDLPEFDKSKMDDPYYCVEWGIKKGQWIEEGVLDRLINDIKNNKL